MDYAGPDEPVKSAIWLGLIMAYVVHLKEFEGPLDLLLYLIEKAEVDIKDIFISEITDQYLAYMKQLSLVDMDAASEFLEMAANLVYMKSRQLLPPKRQDVYKRQTQHPIW